MNENCLDIGIIQAFVDGELSHHEIARVSGHIEMCDSCASMLGEAEDQAALVYSALDREFNSLVPTHRLWNKINESIEAQRSNRPFWRKAWAFLAMSFANPSMVAAAGLFIVIGAFAVVLLDREPADNVAVSLPVPTKVTPRVVEHVAQDPVPAAAVSTPDTVSNDLAGSGPRIEPAVYRPRPAVAREDRPARPAPSVSNGYMEGEESYVRTISTLARTVSDQKDAVLSPSERVAYERDMALVNDTITRMREEVKRNPRNEAAKQVLYSSYQNKIDLLNSVSQKEELVASLK